MKLRVEVICVDESGKEQRSIVARLERQELAMETLGLSLAEGKTILHQTQDCMVSEQLAEHLRQQRNCPHCARRYALKETGRSNIETVFGSVKIPNPRWERCTCQKQGAKTFRPTARWIKGRTSPERLYLETKWGSLIPYAKVADLLKEVLPLSESTNQQTVCEHLHSVAERMEAELGEERHPNPIQPEIDPELGCPDGPMTVGLDGGYVRAAHKEGFFEVIAGRSVVAFRRKKEDAIPPPKCFGFVQTYDQKPRRRLWDLMKSQGMQENQQVMFFSDGGEDIRQTREYLHPNGEHVLDWFHITMRLTVLQQQTKTVQRELPECGADASKQIESIKHLLWHGNVEKALDRLGNLITDLELLDCNCVSAEKLTTGLSELQTYIRNNELSIPNYGERYRQGETISTAFVESTINQVVSRRFVKRQQMQWTPRGAHLLLQTRTKVLNDELDDVFRHWYPLFRVENKTV